MDTLTAGMLEQAHKALGFAHDLAFALEDFVYVAVAVRDFRTPRSVTVANWAGNVPDSVTTRAPYIALEKLVEMLQADSDPYRLLLTPVPNYERGRNWMGGAAYREVYIAASKWAQEWDRLISLLTLYNSTIYPIQLHHVGFRFESEAAFLQESDWYHTHLYRPTDDHQRIYIPKGTYYKELQWFPDGPHDRARHWDFVVPNAHEFLRWVGAAYNITPTFWEYDDNAPLGVVWVPDSEGNKLGVMAREHDWRVEED